jgi:hypothetical protein
VFVDADSLVMTDMARGERATVRPDSGVILEVYRGQHRSGKGVAKGGAKGAVKGAAVGAAEGLLVGGLSKLLGAEADISKSIKAGIVLGTATGVLVGANQALEEGDAVWERVTLLQLRQQICRCANPDRTMAEPPAHLIPEQF